MTREEFISYALLQSLDPVKVENLLKFRDKECGPWKTIGDLSEYVNKTQDFVVVKISTPFGESHLIVDKDSRADVAKWLQDHSEYGLGLASEGLVVA